MVETSGNSELEELSSSPLDSNSVGSINGDNLDDSFDQSIDSDGTLENSLQDSFIVDEVEEELGNLNLVSDHACAYCSIDSPTSVAKCNDCKKWFCNSKIGCSSSHIVNHLVASHHKVVSLHEDSDFGDTVLECYNCGCQNIFLLGFVAAKSEAVVVILCRLPCAQTKNVNWDTDQWQPLIDNRQLLSWVAEEPSDEDKLKASRITRSQISKLEVKWRSNKDATVKDIEDLEAQEEVPTALLKYTDAYEYQRTFGPLVLHEANYDKQLRESQGLEHISVTWTLAQKNQYLASFMLSTYDSNDLKVNVGDEMILRYSGLLHPAWEGRGYILRLPGSIQQEFTLELKKGSKNPPTNLNTGFTAEFVWKGTTYDRMQDALKKFAVDKKSISGYLYYKILGHDVPEIKFDVNMPKDFTIPNFTALNQSQKKAISHVLQQPLSLIQGPPGTGKTVTSAAIVYFLSKMHKEHILVCAPSNVAVDHIASKLRDMGLKIVRLTARSREDVESSVMDLSLHNLLKRSAKGELKRYLNLKDSGVELTNKQSRAYVKLLRKLEFEIFKKADVVCCTCVCAGDRRLERKFKYVLIDESTQASEPECLIPMVKGAKQVVLVGDHQQLGPVILDRKADKAGLKQSLFERLIQLGHVPIRLEIQYRMHPHLSEFSSNTFYDGVLQNGVTIEERTISNNSFPWPISDIPMMFWANYGREEISANGTSYLNRIEAINCERVISRLFKDGVKPEQIGVVTPYEGQRAYIVQYMQMNGAMDKDMYLNVEVASVDSFQGREKDYIILSCVRANDQKSIGFLVEPRRLNVALTRAKYGLVILGNPTSLSRNSTWNDLLVHFREKGCLVEGTMDNLQLCTVQLTRAKKRSRRFQNADQNGSWQFDDGNELQEVPFFNNREVEAHSLMSFGGQALDSVFMPSSNLSSFIENQNSHPDNAVAISTSVHSYQNRDEKNHANSNDSQPRRYQKGTNTPHYDTVEVEDAENHINPLKALNSLVSNK
ncbi:HHR150Cp [Eremothecium sinecaudum]|uniref:HHR150Cp n=1 Tax=Eremothecium sinecaudum TaxID=45286 RepID=A0A0X8HWQ9_9SACH|nr:HHR150Cp [Eremothecium sinecaudum]AMD22919.1 HHR150Cp [Eremothecium sinecaudum]